MLGAVDGAALDTTSMIRHNWRVSHDPLRPEPGPRDWSPPGWDLPPARSSAARRAGGFRFTDGDGAFTVLLLGIIALLAASVSVPGDNGSATVLLSSLGVFAVIAGVVVLRRARLGQSILSRGRRFVATIGTALGVIALVSTIATAINVTASTTLPTLHDAVRALVATTVSGPDLAPPSQADPGRGPAGALEPGAVAYPITPLPVPAEASRYSFSTAAEEQLYLVEVLERVQVLVLESQQRGVELRFLESTAPLPHGVPDGSIGIGSVQLFEPTLLVLADGTLELTVVGRTYGMTVSIALTTLEG